MQDDSTRTVADAVLKRRVELGLSQSAVARRANIEERSYRVIERGERNVRPATLRSVSTALGWTPESLQQVARGESPTERDAPSPLADQVAELAGRIEHLESLLRAHGIMTDQADTIGRLRKSAANPPAREAS